MLLLLAIAGLLVAGSFVMDNLEDDLLDSTQPKAEDDTMVEQTGTDAADLLMGTQAPDFLEGLEGQDTLDGGGGTDVLRGDGGDDSLFGGAGNDTVLGGVGFDALFGGMGEDRLDGQEGNDLIFAASGDDVVFGGTDQDVLFGGAGEDSLVGNAGRDVIFGVDALLDGEPLESALSVGTDDPFAPFAGLELDLKALAEFGVQLEDDGEADTLFGNNDRDTLVMGSGDVATGGFGQDTFIALSEEEAQELPTITDFNPSRDQLSLIVEGAEAGILEFQDDGADLIVRYDGVDVVRISGLAGIPLDPERIDVVNF